jgi:DNA-directed RNA polymerase specialized sigma24 family protein
MRVNGKYNVFTSLVDTFQTPVYNLCFLLLGNGAAAEQAAQACFVRAYAQFDEDYLTQNTQIWLLRIAYEQCISLHSLSPDQINRAVVALRYTYRLELSDIAWVMNTSGEIVKTRLQQAKRTLAAMYCQEVHRLAEW